MIIKKGDIIHDYKGESHKVAFFMGGLPYGASGSVFVPIYTEKPRAWNEFSLVEKIESRIAHYDYERCWCNDADGIVMFSKEIIKLMFHLIMAKHSI